MNVTLSGDKTINASFGQVSVKWQQANPLVAGRVVVDRVMLDNGAVTLTVNGLFAAGERLSIDLFDPSGRVVERLINTRMASGAQSMRLVSKKYAAGVYYYRIRTGTSIITNMIAVTQK
jgi:hypothetical protein